MKEGFRELGFKLAEAMETSAREWTLDGADITMLLERLSGIVEYVGKG